MNLVSPTITAFRSVMPMIKLVAFDLDGTLADTLADLANAMNYALNSRGLPTYPVEAYRHFVGNGIDNLVKVTMADAYTPAGAEAVKAAFNEYYAGHYLDCTVAYKGMTELLEKLGEQHIAAAVISNKPDRYVPQILNRLYPDCRFVQAWGQREGIARKPDPEALKRLLSLCGVDRDEALYVGDSNVDVVFAHNAGVRVCGVSWGFRGAGELRAAGADHITDTVDDLYEQIIEDR